MAITTDMDRPMEEELSKDRLRFGWGLGASLLLHALAALMLIDGVSGYVSEPLTDVVEVELLAPQQEEALPEQEQPEQTPPEQSPPEQPQPEELETQEAQTPPPEQPDQPETQEEAPPPPPPPPPPPAAEAETPEPPAQALVQEEVTEFGEEDTGERGEDDVAPAVAQSAEGQAEEPGETEGGPDGPGTGEAEAGEEEVAGQTPQETSEEEAPPEETSAEETPDEAAEVANLGVDPQTPPEEASGTEAETDSGLNAETPAEDFGIVGPIATDKTPSPKPARQTASAEPQQSSGQRGGGGGGDSGGPPAGMLAARELFTREILDDPQARTAMGEMSPGQRLNFLCMTELRAQIASVSALPPELLPSFRPRGGTVLQPQNAAFRSLGRWFDVSFRCETDAEVKRVEKFSFKIGREIPPSQWGERGLSGF